MKADQPVLPYGEVPRVHHSDTSTAAANGIDTKKLGNLQARVLDEICGWGPYGATDEEAMRALDIEPNTLRPRRRELQLAGLIVDSGKRRPGRSGRLATVWVRA